MMAPQSKREFFKLRVGLFFGYNGQNYKGSQSQKDPNVPTVENALFKSLIEAKLISENHMGELKKAGWGRGARTDKGVHALCNGVSVKLAINDEYLLASSPLKFQGPDPELIAEEQALSFEISLRKMREEQGYIPETEAPVEEQVEENVIVAEGQDTKITYRKANKEQDERALQKEKQILEEEQNRLKKLQNRIEYQRMQSFADERRKHINIEKIIGELNACLPSDIRAITIKQVTRKFDIRMHCKFRVYEYIMPLFVYQKYEDFIAGVPLSPEEEDAIVKRVDHLAKRFKGSHNYHNYTRGMKAKDPQCLRFINDMHTELSEHKNEATGKAQKFIRFTLTGQSFIYHQIRKMMGMITQMVQENQIDSFMDISFGQSDMKVWLAPAHGLFLNRMRFDGYNKKDQLPELIEFDEKEEARMLELRKIIEAGIMDDESTEKIYRKWLSDIKDPRDDNVDDPAGGNESASEDFADA